MAAPGSTIVTSNEELDRLLAMSPVFNFSSYQVLPLAEMADPGGNVMSERRHITVSGIVQGVGFRPFVHGLALKNGLAGFVLNHPAGVTIELEGEQPALDNFLTVLTEAPPPLARIENIDCSIIPPTGESEFKIVSQPRRRATEGFDFSGHAHL